MHNIAAARNVVCKMLVPVTKTGESRNYCQERSNCIKRVDILSGFIHHHNGFSSTYGVSVLNLVKVMNKTREVV